MSWHEGIVLIGFAGNPLSYSSGNVLVVSLKLDENLHAPTGPVGAAFKVGNEGIELQLDTLPNGLLELDAESCAVAPWAVGIKQSARRILDAGEF